MTAGVLGVFHVGTRFGHRRRGLATALLCTAIRTAGMMLDQPTIYVTISTYCIICMVICCAGTATRAYAVPTGVACLQVTVFGMHAYVLQVPVTTIFMQATTEGFMLYKQMGFLTLCKYKRLRPRDT
jgi:hypothetical protein